MNCNTYSIRARLVKFSSIIDKSSNKYSSCTNTIYISFRPKSKCCKNSDFIRFKPMGRDVHKPINKDIHNQSLLKISIILIESSYKYTYSLSPFLLSRSYKVKGLITDDKKSMSIDKKSMLVNKNIKSKHLYYTIEKRIFKDECIINIKKVGRNTLGINSYTDS